MNFINPTVQAKYQVRPGQLDVDIIIPRLNWRSKLSRITPRVAEHLIATRTNLISRIPQPAAEAPRKKTTRKKAQSS